jgi:uncharacterized protein YkwD
MNTKTKKATEHKRHGRHHRHNKPYKHVYWPYLPLVLSIALSLFVSRLAPRTSTLAYATNTSVSGLLQATNTQRANNGQGSLSLNQRLVSAAQSKADDMIARNYWSHNTPDGKEPWIFVDNAGYKYTKAGEILAYGFVNSEDTVVGWMNSPSHKANMLDSAFQEVGFGFANSTNFNSSGEQTVVVAMYGKPQTLASTAQNPAPASPSTPSKPSTATQPAPDPEPTAPTEEPAPEEPAPTPAPSETVFNTETKGSEPRNKSVTRAEALTGGKAPWATLGVGILLGGSITSMLVKHGMAVRRLLRNSERFVLHHPLFDSTVIGLVILGITLSQSYIVSTNYGC